MIDGMHLPATGERGGGTEEAALCLYKKSPREGTGGVCACRHAVITLLMLARPRK